jgi:hypothetical protein
MTPKDLAELALKTFNNRVRMTMIDLPIEHKGKLISELTFEWDPKILMWTTSVSPELMEEIVKYMANERIEK